MTTETKKDVIRALHAINAIQDGRSFEKKHGEIMVTVETVITTVLLRVCNGDPRFAASMLNEGLVYAIENRLAHYENVMRSET